MTQLTETELQALERMEPHEFHRVLMQIVAGGMTAWRNESAHSRNNVPRESRQTYFAVSTPFPRENVETVETLV